MRRYSRAIAAIALLALVAVWVWYPATGVPILAYHKVCEDDDVYSVAPAEFEAEMQYIRDKGYTAVSLAELTAAWAGNGKLPPKPIVISFDDGYRDNYLTALPIMEKHGLKGTVFVITGSVGQEGYLSWAEIKAMQAGNTEIGSHTVSHVSLTELGQAERLKEVTESKAALERELGTPVAFLAYPYGNFDQGMFAILQQAGYRGACSGLTGLNKPGTPPYALKRINIPRSGKFGLWEFRLRLLRGELYSKLGI